MRREREPAPLFVHLVWGTWDRLPLLEGETRKRVYHALAAKCEELGAPVVALGGVADHVHLLVRLPVTLAVADLMKQVKGASAHFATHELASGQFFKWQGAYGACSVSPRHLDQVSDYIRRQAEHHAAGTLNPRLELEPPP